MSYNSRTGFVEDGADRLRRASKAGIAAEVRARYAARLADASPIARLLIELRIRREIQAELSRRIPANALY